MPIVVNEGTQTTVAAIANSGTQYPIVKLDIGSGTAIADFGGTITRVTELLRGTVTNLATGTINALVAGTITGGTLGNLNFGTVATSAIPVTIGTSYGTLGTTGVAVIGTLIAASGAGTRQYISGLSMVVASGTVDCAITNVGTVAGPNGAGVLARGFFPPGLGIRATFNPVEVSGTNGTIGYWMGGAGTVYFTVNYWQGV